MDDYEIHLAEEVIAGRMTRDELIRRAGIAGISLSAFGFLLGDRATAAAYAPTTVVAKRGGTARFGITTPATDVDPVTMFNTGAIMTSQVAGEYLVFPDPQYRLQPRLATKWLPGATPKTWTFTLRKNVLWHDGKPFTADDVVYTMNLLTDPKSNSSALSAFKGVLSHGNVEKVGRYQVRFHLDRAFADFPYLVSAFNYNSIILPKNYQIGDYVKGNVGTGPFILKQYTPKVGAKFVRNPKYWGKGLPYLNGVEIKYFADTPPIVLALQAGSIDAFPQTPYQGSQALFRDKNIKVLQDRSSEYRTLQMRVDQGAFKDRRVRQAMALSLDRPAIVQGLFGGRAEVGNDHAFAPVYPTSALAVKQVAQRRRDLAKAKKLLAAAGHARGLSVTLTTEQFLEIPQYAVFIKQMSKAAGFDVKLNIEDQNTFYGSGANQPWLQVDFGITDWGARGTPSQTIGPAYLCRSVPKPDLSNAGAWNSAHWCNKRFDGLVQQFDAERDEQKRLKLAVQAARVQQAEVPDIIAYWIKEQRAVRKNVQGLPAGPTFHLDTRAVWLS